MAQLKIGAALTVLLLEAVATLAILAVVFL